MQQWIPFMPEDASTISGEVDDFYFFLVGMSLFFVVLIAGLEVFFALKYRRQRPDEIPRPVRSAVRLEVVWIIIPFIIAMVIFGWGAKLFYTMNRMPKEALDIFVVGKQWMWKLQHLEGQREINELHIPVGRKVKLTMTTEDVIHSFYIPAFRVKMDVVPGRYTHLWFEAKKPGRYHLFCAEYCGTNHSGMIGWVYAMEPADYQAWLSGGAGEGSLASSGEKLFQQLACNNCHHSDTPGRGPALEGLFGRTVALDNGQTIVADENYIRESIENSQAKIVAGFQRPSLMPTFQGQITEDQMLQLIAYIKSISAPPASGGQTPAASPPAATGTGANPTNQ